MTTFTFELAVCTETAASQSTPSVEYVNVEGRIESLDGYKRIMVSLRSGVKFELRVFRDEAVTEDVVVVEDGGTTPPCEGDSAGNDLPSADGTELSDQWSTMSQSEAGSLTTESASTGSSSNDAIAGNNQVVFRNYSLEIAEEEKAVVPNRPRILQRASWESTEDHMAGMGTNFEDEQFLIPNHDIMDEEL